MKSLSGILLVLSLLTPLVVADDPPEDPILLLETGGHSGRILHLAVDRDEKFLVTGSFDKTVRVWSMSSGKLLRTFRLPIDHGREGRVASVAITPDGRMIACSGFTGHWDQDFSIYIFDRETGALVHRISRLPSGALSFAYSPDGKFLAAGLGDSRGVQVFRVPGYEPAWADDSWDTNDGVMSLQFATRKSDGWLLLAAASSQGSVRLYAAPRIKRGLAALIAKDEPGAVGLAALAFSPDASRLVVANSASPDLRILSTDDLAERSRFKGCGDSSEISTVAWSADGRSIVESILHWVGGNVTSRILKWNADGAGNPAEVVAGTDVILHIIALKRGGVAYTGLLPEIGVIDRNWKRVLHIRPKALDYRGHPDQLLVSADGSRVQYGDMWFSVPDRVLGSGECPWKGELRHPFSTASPLPLSDWRDSSMPKLAGKALNIDEETALSAAFSPDGGHFALGTSDGYRFFDKTGKEKWAEVGYLREAGAISISGNGKVVVAALADGTIHWARARDGELLMVLYVHPDGHSWVLWTPDGHYDAGPGGEKLLGWHVNHGADAAAEFLPVSEFRQAHRPDVISAILTTLDVKAAVRVANDDATRKPASVLLPGVPADGRSSGLPVVRIVFPADGATLQSNHLTLRYVVRGTAEPVTRVLVLVDGNPAELVPGTRDSSAMLARNANSAHGDVLEARLRVPERDCEVTILVEDRHSISEPATVRLKWLGAQGRRDRH